LKPLLFAGKGFDRVPPGPNTNTGRKTGAYSLFVRGKKKRGKRPGSASGQPVIKTSTPTKGGGMEKRVKA